MGIKSKRYGSSIGMHAVALLLLFTGGISIAAEHPEIGKVAKVYGGAEGLTLYTLRFGPKSDNTFIIKYDGIDNDWSGRWHLSERIPAGTGHDYVVSHNGKDFHTIVSRDTWGWKQMQVYLPGGGPSGVYVSYDEGASKAAVPQHMLTEYLKQQKKD